MTIFSNNSIFTPISKYLKYNNSNINVINGVNTLSNLPLCDVKIKYEQYQRINVQIPKNAIDFVLSFPMLGIKTTFITIKANYSSSNENLNYLKWKFQPSSDTKWSFTNILTFTGTSSNPVPPILIDNPNANCIVTLDILVSALENDYLNDVGAFVYLDGLTYDKVHTYNEIPSSVLSFFNSNNELVSTVDIVDIINVQKVPNKNRIIIDESSQNNIVLDFISEYDTLQALSAINWVLLDPQNNALPTTPDLIQPIITYTNKVNIITSTINIDLSQYSLNTYTKQNFIDDAISAITDNRDGNTIIVSSNIIFKHGINNINTILVSGNYTVDITVTDIAGNSIIETLNIIAHDNITDITPPIFAWSNNIIGNTANNVDINTYNNIFTHNDAKNYCIDYITDNIDGMIPKSNVNVQFTDLYGNVIPSITTEGYYTIDFSVQDNANNSTNETINIYINNPLVNSAPFIFFSNNVTLPALTATISLANDYGSGIGIFTKNDVITHLIDNVIDDIDGVLTLNSANITIIDNLLISIPSILNIGLYTIAINVTDSGANTIIKNIILTVNS